MSSTTHGAKPYYFLPEPSRHPAMAAFGLFFVILGGCLCCSNGSAKRFMKANLVNMAARLICLSAGA